MMVKPSVGETREKNDCYPASTNPRRRERCFMTGVAARASLIGKRSRSESIRALFAILLSIASCGEDEPLGPNDKGLTPAAKPSPADPTVNSTDPDSASPNTTLVVRILGSGYDTGSVAEFVLDGQAIPQVRTNSTTYVSSRELRANITIDADAPLELYDVIVTTSKGKRGIGIELFAVTITAVTIGPVGSGAWAVGADGDVAGETVDRRGIFHVFYWTEAGGLEEVGLGTVHDMSDDGRIIGMARPEEMPMVWTRSGSGSWTSEVLPVPVGALSAYALSINPAGDRIAGSIDARPAIWHRFGANWSVTLLPEIAGESVCTATGGVNDEGLIAGFTKESHIGCVWIEEAGTWRVHLLESPANAPEGVSTGDINAAGDVLGWIKDEGSNGRVIVWHRTSDGWSAPEEIPWIPIGSLIEALTDSGRIAGAYIRDGNWRAFVCCASGFQDLGSTSGNQSLAHAASSRYVVGSSGGNGKFRAVRWTLP
jgi:hypothetical protein